MVLLGNMKNETAVTNETKLNAVAYCAGAIAHTPAAFWRETFIKQWKPIKELLRQSEKDCSTSYYKGQLDYHNLAIIPHGLMNRGENPTTFIDRVREEQSELKKLRAKVKRLEKALAN